MRNICKICKRTPCAVNYHKNDRVYYRSTCDHCARGSKKLRPLWALSGYKKKNSCDRCGFQSKFSEQFDVYHIDGNLSNCKYSNLKTVCANCQRVLVVLGITWRQGDLKPDF